MGKLYIFLLLSILFLDVTLQAKGKTVRRNNRNSSDMIHPRTFRGHSPTTKSLSLPNGTQKQAPHSSLNAHPLVEELWLPSNSTAEYLSGALSTRVIPGVYLLAIVVGIPANVAILSALVTKVRMVSSAILYCSLALSDILLLLSLLPKVHYHLHGNHWAFGEATCRMVTACFYGNLYCSAHTLACISVKRYLAVVHPFLYRRLPKRACSAWACLVVWLVFGAAAVPELLVQQSYRLPQLGLTTCHDVLPLDYNSHAPLIYYKVFLTFLGLLLPLVLTAGCYAFIVYELNHTHYDWALYVKASSLVFVMFLVCFVPAGTLHFLHYVRLFAEGEDGFYAYFSVAVCLCCLHSCLDPFLFLLVSKSTRTTLHFTTLKGKVLSVTT
ncbi:proteinase-activated receptor 3 isoform X1 [Osmerus eperlanus]|uniref:proteinase-activated receptor 3 isoform X1 n=1 Tax=Osmerus eperlanus TaxID=29151 RepID=UPI002E132919